MLNISLKNHQTLTRWRTHLLSQFRIRCAMSLGHLVDTYDVATWFWRDGDVIITPWIRCTTYDPQVWICREFYYRCGKLAFREHTNIEKKSHKRENEITCWKFYENTYWCEKYGCVWMTNNLARILWICHVIIRLLIPDNCHCIAFLFNKRTCS